MFGTKPQRRSPTADALVLRAQAEPPAGALDPALQCEQEPQGVRAMEVFWLEGLPVVVA